MKEHDDDKYIGRLYKQYKEHRDSASAGILNNIMAAAKASSAGSGVEKNNANSAKEAHIQTILHAATTATTITANSAPKELKKPRLQPLLSWFKNLLQPSWGMSSLAASVLVAAFALTAITQWAIQPQNSVNLVALSSLDNCQICGDLAINSTIKMRNINTNPKTTDSPNNKASKYGQFAFGLNLINQLNSDNQSGQRKSLINAINKLAEETDNKEVFSHFKQLGSQATVSSSQTNEAIKFLASNFTDTSDKSLFSAGQWLERLRISSERAIEEREFSSFEHSFEGVNTLQSTLATLNTANPRVISSINKLSNLQENASLAPIEKAQQASALTMEILRLLNE